MDEITEQIDQYTRNWNDEALWVGEILAIVFITLLVSLILRGMLYRVSKRAEKTENSWDDALVHALKQPVRLVVWVFGLTLAVEVTFSDDPDNLIFNYLQPAENVLYVIAVIWCGTRFIDSLQARLVEEVESEKRQADLTTIFAITKLLKVTIIITGILIILQTLGFSISGVLAAGGVSGLVIGFAAKDLLANFFGAVMIYMDKPFKVGDWIRSPDKEIEGTVEEISWRLTRIRTFDKRPLYVPNSVFTTISIENPSRMKNRRIKEIVGVRYDDMEKVDKITRDIEAMLGEHDAIDQRMTTFAKLIAFNASTLDILVYTFTKTTKWVEFQGIKQEIMLKIADIVAQNGAEIAYPTRTLHIPESIAAEMQETDKANT